MIKQTVRIVAVSVDTAVITLYTVDGQIITIDQGDLRVPGIINVARDNAHILNSGGVCEVDITPVYVEKTEYASAEKGTNGVVRFFRMAKSALKKLMDTDSPDKLPTKAAMVSPLEIGILPGLTKNEDPVSQLYSLTIIGLRDNYNRVGAIKFIRELCGVGLRESKEMLEQPMPIVLKEGLTADAVDPTELDIKSTEPEKVEEVKAKAAKTNKLAQQASVLLAQLKAAQTSDQASHIAAQLISFKAQSKKSWAYLQVPADEVTFIMGSIRKQVNVKADAIQAEAKAIEKRKENNRNGGKGGPSAQIRELLDNRPLTKSQYSAIILIKRKAKKSWSALGVTEQEQAEIEKATAV